MPEVRVGSGPYLISSQIETNTKTGSETVETWEGTEAEVNSKRALLIGLGATKLTTGPKGDGAWTLRASFPFNTDDPAAEKFVNVMELEVSAVNRSIYQSPIYRKYFSDYVAASGDSPKARATLPVIADCANHYLGKQIVRVGTKFKYHKEDSVSYDTPEEATWRKLFERLDVVIPALTVGEKNRARLMFDDIAWNGVTSFIEYNQVFRRQITAGSPDVVRASYTGVGQIWTTAEVTAFEAVPADGWFVLPTGVQWHKSKPQVLSAYGQKTQLTYHYTEIITATANAYEKYSSAVLVNA